MKIGFDASDLTTNRADGTTRYTRELVTRLPLLGPGHDWQLFAPGDFQTDTPLAPNTQKVISPWPKYWTQARLPFNLLAQKPDVLFMPIQQLPILRPRSMKTVAVIHDLAFQMFGKQYTYKDWLLLHAFTAQVARQADTIIAVSQSTANDIARCYGRTRNVQVIHHGVDLQKFHVPVESEKESSWQQLVAAYPKLRKPYVLYVGQIQPRKNLPALIKAFEIAHGKNRDLQLVMASGHGWKQAETLEAIKNSRVAEHIYMPGKVSDGLLPALYGHASALALVSLYEGFGMPILEALACGTPVVTSNVSSMSEVGRGQTILVNPNDTESIADGLLKALAAPRGKGLGQEFSWEVTAQKTLRAIVG
ncbi:MAG: glycosyltransferase family 4 protein [Candidatus Andersenbacteria bacterium]|nr:glycosyltransferase family 4 protein [Candidatus Andersenbacteria bacterium]